MKKISIIALSLAWIASGASAPLAKSYSVESMRIDAVVSTDGAIRIDERITYRFDGSFSYAYREVPLKSGEDIVDVRVTEGGRTYERSDRDAAWTYTVSPTGESVRITWRYEAENEERTFIVSYAVTGVVRRHADVAEIYYKLVGEAWDRPIGRVDAEIRLPEAAEDSDVRAWAHGPLHGTVKVLPKAVVSLGVSPLPAHTFFETRVICPAEVFAGLEPVSGDSRLKAILAEEAKWAEDANERRREWRERLERNAEEAERRARRGRELLPLSFLLLVCALGIWFWLYQRHGRPHALRSRVAPGDIPSEHPPVVISYLMHRMVTGPAVAATLVDLANRGYLEIRESIVETKGLFGKKKREADYRFEVVAKPLSELEAYERDLLQFVLIEAGDSTGFSVSALRKAASGRRSRFQKFFREWNKQIADYARTLGFFEPYPVRAMAGNVLCGVLVLAAGVGMSVRSQVHVGIPAIVGGFVQAILTVTLTRRTPEGRRLMLAWKAFGSHLKSLTRGRGPVSLESSQWGRYLSAAILFGLYRQLLPNLRIQDGHEAAVYPAWFYGVPGAPGLDGGISGLASGLSTMVAAVNTAASSAAGAGGGASGGGGGGSGGGGGGAG